MIDEPTLLTRNAGIRMVVAFQGTELTKAEKQVMRPNKDVLVEALRHMPTICPPRVAQQSKIDLQRLVNKALWRPDGDPVRLAMQQALRDARAHCCP